ncbi:DNA-binding response regulator [Paenibacillus oralis]|uniref:DNA-binding response regulator n=1 Tax=Paenibacillus oralis TaxID=2490856 RepID=A0A3P3TCJ4_9BACL|nr:LytTR family DNA-binding domain-containing protein [Paenibacillus oralis]RRJ54818.1 DNA-binding response regulator [Paenibacillus oralis]
MEQQGYKVLIAEDDIHQMSLLKKIINDMDLVIVSTVSSGIRLIEETKQHKPDIILLDIRLKKLDGISGIKEIHAAGLHPQVIFVTGSLKPEHLLAGFEFESVDYITKPINEIRLKKAINKAKDQIHAKKLLDADVQESIHWVILKQNYRDVTVAENQIIYVEKDKLHRNKYIVHLKDGTLLETSTQLKEIKEMCSDNLVYSHRSYLVNALYIAAIQPDGHISKSYTISLEHTSDKVPLTKKNINEASDVFLKFRAQLTF